MKSRWCSTVAASPLSQCAICCLEWNEEQDAPPLFPQFMSEQLNLHAFIVESFKDVASDMERTRINPEAVLQYDLLADALAWSDEYPANSKRPPVELSSVRVLLRYRTTIILQSPDERLKPYWEQALLMFPNWGGFTPGRSKPSADLVEYYESQRKAGGQSLVRLNKFLRRRCPRGEGGDRRIRGRKSFRVACFWWAEQRENSAFREGGELLR